MRSSKYKMKIFYGSQGSILMETLLVLPLYIAFFSGIFLVGDLEACMGKLYAADRTAVMQQGNRHSSKNVSADSITKLFYRSDDGSYSYGNKTKIKEVPGTPESKNKVWSYVVQGKNEFSFTLPAWTIGWQKAVNMIWDNKSQDWDDSMKLENKEDFYVFMRQKDTSRENQTGKRYGNQTSWESCYNSPFLPSALSASKFSDAEVYIRHAQYVTWSAPAGE